MSESQTEKRADGQEPGDDKFWLSRGYVRTEHSWVKFYGTGSMKDLADPVTDWP